MACTCGDERSWLMLIWGRHYEGCPEIKKWPGVGVPLLALLLALPASAGEKWGEPCRTPPAPREHYLTCPKGQRPMWRCIHPECPPGNCEAEAWHWEERCAASKAK